MSEIQKARATLDDALRRGVEERWEHTVEKRIAAERALVDSRIAALEGALREIHERKARYVAHAEAGDDKAASSGEALMHLAINQIPEILTPTATTPGKAAMVCSGHPPTAQCEHCWVNGPLPTTTAGEGEPKGLCCHSVRMREPCDACEAMNTTPTTKEAADGNP